MFKDPTSLGFNIHVSWFLLHRQLCIKICTVPLVSPSGQCLFPSFCLKLQLAVVSQTESSLLLARTNSGKGGLGAIQLVLMSGVIPETTCKAIFPLVLLWGLPQTCHTTLSPFCGFWQKRKKKETKRLTKNCDGFWLVSGFQHNFLLWHWELGFSKASNFSAYVSLSQINLWKRGCRGLCKTCWHSCISLLLKWFVFF